MAPPRDAKDHVASFRNLFLQQLNCIKAEDYGVLYGLRGLETRAAGTASLEVWGLVKFIEVSNGKDQKWNTVANILSLLPNGAQIIGAFVSRQASSVDEMDIVEKLKSERISHLVDQLRQLLDPEHQAIFICCLQKCDDGSSDKIICCHYDVIIEEVLDELRICDVEDVAELSESHLMVAYVTFHLTGRIPIAFELFSSDEDTLDAMHWAVKLVKEEFETSVWAFQLTDAKNMVLCASVKSVSNRTACRLLYEQVQNSQMRKKGYQEKIQVSLLKQVSGDNAVDAGLPCAPVISYQQKKSCQCVSLTLPFDVIVFVHESVEVDSLAGIFTNALSNQLVAIEDCLQEYYKENTFHAAEVLHFLPVGSHHLFSAVFPRGYSDSDLVPERCRLHDGLAIAKTRPTFRRANSLQLLSATSENPYLRNVHVGLPKSGLAGDGVSSSLVTGSYAYHHYMQDGMDDSGWGCAYRSLQTIVSWFRMQGYTDILMPTHRLIQQTLVDIEDKPASFVGSKQWIGSTEIGFVLNQLLGVESRYIVVNSGEDLGGKGRELSMHFQTQGSPVMIGGGQLAHTILGVDWSEQTGEIKFLVLDPHYTGPENIVTIQSKGWCGWKDLSFWDPTTFYNICMPQVPIMF